MKPEKQGKIVIISSPSGGGKTSICRRLLNPTRKKKGWKFSISYTTRTKRRGERHGREYYFVDDSTFSKMLARNAFAEHFKVHLYHYGTPRDTIDRTLKSGGVLLLDVDCQGALKLKKDYPEAITIFILPPSIAALKRRLKARGTETREQLKVRFENSKKEMRQFRQFEYVVINDDLDEAVKQVLSIINCHFCRTEKLRPEQIRKIVG
jgi:guanylate kinase